MFFEWKQRSRKINLETVSRRFTVFCEHRFKEVVPSPGPKLRSQAPVPSSGPKLLLSALKLSHHLKLLELALGSAYD